jgi:hypothetical protein
MAHLALTAQQAVRTPALRRLTKASRNARERAVSGPLRPGTYPLLFEVVREATAACRLSRARRVPFYWRGVRLTAASSALGVVRVYHPETDEVLACSGYGACW